MKIIINGKSAVLKKGTSFDFVSENRLFYDAEGYSFLITLPLKNCIENIKIFGHIDRTDFTPNKIFYSCQIICKDIFVAGIFVITELSDIEVKGQFLTGKSVENFNNDFEDIYINELDLGSPEITDPSKISPEEAWNIGISGREAVALPWVNNNGESGNIQNEATYSEGIYTWADNVTGLSWQPYLIDITYRICLALGYDANLEEWGSHPTYRYLLICNSLPFAWEMPEYAKALPHWSVKYFFEQIELLVGGEFTWDHVSKIVKFSFTTRILENLPFIKVDKPLDCFSVEIDEENYPDYLPVSIIKYKSIGHHMEKYYDCKWFIDYMYFHSTTKLNRVITYDKLESFLSKIKTYMPVKYELNNITNDGTFLYPPIFLVKEASNKLYYVIDIDTYFILIPYEKWVTEEEDSLGFKHKYLNQNCYLLPINNFAPINNNENASEVEIAIVPVPIDELDVKNNGFSMFLTPGASAGAYDTDVDYSTSTYPLTIISQGDIDQPEAFYDSIFIAFWSGSYKIGKLPIPLTDSIVYDLDWQPTVYPGYSLRLKDITFFSSLSNDYKNLDVSKKYQFSFLMKNLPNVRSIFYINGKKYLCEKITTTFSENGMSELKKGVFYRIID